MRAADSSQRNIAAALRAFFGGRCTGRGRFVELVDGFDQDKNTETYNQEADDSV